MNLGAKENWQNGVFFGLAACASLISTFDKVAIFIPISLNEYSINKFVFETCHHGLSSCSAFRSHKSILLGEKWVRIPHLCAVLARLASVLDVTSTVPRGLWKIASRRFLRAQ